MAVQSARQNPELKKSVMIIMGFYASPGVGVIWGRGKYCIRVS